MLAKDYGSRSRLQRAQEDFTRNHTKDEDRSIGVDMRERISNQFELLWQRPIVVTVKKGVHKTGYDVNHGVE